MAATRVKKTSSAPKTTRKKTVAHAHKEAPVFEVVKTTAIYNKLSLIIGGAILVLILVVAASLFRHIAFGKVSAMHMTRKIVAQKMSPKVMAEKKPAEQSKGGTYTIVSGDNLWKIAEKVYNDGFKWVLIANANNYENNPGLIHAGNTIVIPQAGETKMLAQVKPAQVTVDPTMKPIAKAVVGKTSIAIREKYTVVHGDSLWKIAEKMYGNGFKWVDIARANNISDPGLIFSGNTLQLPKA